jgi:NAD(P)-dependent dehydrogenase (short-subunit alcohol dehydrogenase family)
MSKLFLLMWTRELAARVSSDKIIINSVCPGLTSSSIDRGLPWYAKHVVSGMRQLIARTPKQGASTYLIAISAPDAAHGSFYSDGVILKYVMPLY